MSSFGKPLLPNPIKNVADDLERMLAKSEKVILFDSSGFEVVAIISPK